MMMRRSTKLESRGLNGLVRLPVSDTMAPMRLGLWVASAFRNLRASSRGAILLCIGSDRSTGDALGPLTGSMLVERGFPEALDGSTVPRFPSSTSVGVVVMGTLENPVHAVTLADAIERLRSSPAVVLAIDACLGQSEHVGSVCAGWGPLRPGAGVNKDLPPVGDVHITGTVNVAGFMEYLVLQNTRLSIVMRLARMIVDSLVFATSPGPLLPPGKS